MGSTRNIQVGGTYRNWTVIACVSSTAKNPANHTYACKCMCGAERVLLAHSLVQGTSMHCPKCGKGSKRKGLNALHASVGDVFGRWTVTGDMYTAATGRRVCPCICECGRHQDVDLGSLVYGNSTQCSKCAYANRPTAIGRKLPTGKRNPAYTTWKNIRSRCTKVNHKDYSLYGGRGIKVCAEWQASFDAFYAYVGDRPSDRHSLDRIDNEKGYEPGNVRWATTFEQANNKRNNVQVTAFGKTQSLGSWASETGLQPAVIRSRIDAGWVPEDALSVTQSYLAAHDRIMPGEARRDCLLRELASLDARRDVLVAELAKYRDDA